MAGSDHAIILTADDAILAKQATVDSGYYSDPFLNAFASSAVGLSGPSPMTRRQHHQPIIKRGTHARVSCMDRGINAFLALPHDEIPQVVVLGAGLDTTFYRYFTGMLPDMRSSGVKWYEVDHPGVIQSKASTVLQLTQSTMFPQSTTIQPTNSGFLVSTAGTNVTCFMVGRDLRQSGLLDQLKDFKKTAPTLFVLECVKMYLPTDKSQSLLECLSQQCLQACILLYDPILGRSPFGRVMEDHLCRAGVATSQSSMIQTRTISQHLEQLVGCGFRQAVGCDMWTAYQTVVSSAQRQQANKCEILDEMEEWMMIMSHYCLVVACNNDSLAPYCEIGLTSPLGFATGKCEVLVAWSS
jgi:O-methyltransferase involved in polyketide biosynthesis